MRWQFDEKVAAAFEDIAQKNIPNYDIVINRCVELAKDVFVNRPDARILEVGSARGMTLKRLIAAGFANTYGVESSPHMIAASAHADHVILSDRFPAGAGSFDMVLANWTLHFISERAAYMQAIFDHLNPGGVFVLSDRMLGSPTSYRRYLDFKRGKGVSEQEIIDKEASLQGVLEPRPLEWYQATLQKIGFTAIEIIDAAWCFNTIMCRKSDG